MSCWRCWQELTFTVLLVAVVAQLLADSLEALIGAYLMSGGSQAAKAAMLWAGISPLPGQEVVVLLSDPYPCLVADLCAPLRRQRPCCTERCSGGQVSFGASVECLALALVFLV
jgi:hypothetical protein